MGLEISSVLTPSPEIIQQLSGKRHGVFYVEEAAGSPYIPAQKEFVDRYGIRSVLGFGGMLGNGELFAVILFATVHVPTNSAQRFRTLALDVKSLFNKFNDETTFSLSTATPPRPAGRL
jgi:hypothetical protein